jgi:serine/threonine-protein kinase
VPVVPVVPVEQAAPLNPGEPTATAIAGVATSTAVEEPVESALIVMSDPSVEAPSAPPVDTEQMPIEATPAGAITATLPFVTPFPYDEATDEQAGEDDSGSILYDEERRPRRWGKILLILLLVLIGIAAASYAAYLLLRTKSYEVPDLVGVPEAVARNEVSGNGWEIETVHERSDVQRGIGDVIATDPAAGVRLDEGESITFVISDGPLLRTLPELEGLPLDDAQAELEELELDWIVAPAEFDEEIPPEFVISWRVQNAASLQAGGQVLPGTVVVLTPSMGPEPRTVPDLTNHTFDDASAELAARRLRIERTDDVFSDQFEPGRIVSQTPASESVVERESTVTVTVSKGPDVVAFPDVVGMTYTDGEALLIESGFTIGTVLGTTDGTIQSAGIGGNPVGPGDIYRRGTAVDLVSL